MLGLGASHLALTDSSPGDMNFRALDHQIKALNQLRTILDIPAKSRQEADARFATFMILVFQSSYMADGIVDFFTMLRGCVLQGEQVDPIGSDFINILKMNHMNSIDSRLEAAKFQPVDTVELDRYIASVTALKPYCSQGIELDYHSKLLQSGEAAYSSHRDGKQNLF
jgi:hypothetical protein